MIEISVWQEEYFEEPKLHKRCGSEMVDVETHRSSVKLISSTVRGLV